MLFTAFSFLLLSQGSSQLALLSGSLAQSQEYGQRYQALLDALANQALDKEKSFQATRGPLEGLAAQLKEANFGRLPAIKAAIAQLAKPIATDQKTIPLQPIEEPNRFQEQIQADLEQVKEEVNLVAHAIWMGYILNKKKSCRRYAILDKGADKLLMPTRPNRQSS